jgi:hypothetical protein
MIIFVFLAISAALIPLGESMPDMTVSIKDYSAPEGETVDIYIDVKDTETVGSMDITIEFDPMILNLEEVLKGDLTDDGIVEHNVKDGVMKIIVNVLEGFSGSGTVASLRFMVTGTPGSSCELTLTNVEANHAETFVDIILSTEDGSLLVKPPKMESSISCSAAPRELKVGETVEVTGALEPVKEGITVTIKFNRPDGTESSKITATQSDGTYELLYSPESEGDWTVSSSWEGDTSHSGAVSQSVSFSVEEESGDGGIPGFPYESILLGLLVGIVILWLIQRK